MKLFLKAHMVELSAQNDPERRWLSRWIEVSDNDRVSKTPQKSVDKFAAMCMALRSDIQSAKGAGATALEDIRAIENGTESYIEADGNAHIAFITPHEVWFQNLYIDIDESPVSFRQYKLAVETWVKFLADPERKPIVVPFPDDVLDRTTLPPRPPRNEE